MLTANEVNFIEQQLNKYDIKYQEIYDELKDHLISAVEQERLRGDIRDVQVLLQDVIKTQFPGWWPFEDIAKTYESAYRQKLWRNFYRILKINLRPEFTLLLVLIALSGYFIPAHKPQRIALMIGLYIVGMLPAVYTIYFAAKLKKDKGKKSLVGGQVTTIAYLLLIVLNVMFNVFRQIDATSSWAFLNPIHYPPSLFTTLIALFLFYGTSSIVLCRQEFKIAS